MQEQYYSIGETAGKIYRVLENSGELALSKLQKDVGESDSALFNQAIGWLARENNINICRSGKTVKVSLSTSKV